MPLNQENLGTSAFLLRSDTVLDTDNIQINESETTKTEELDVLG